MIPRLLEDHRRILSLADGIEAVLEAPRPADLSDLSRLRWTLTRELLQHLALEDLLLEGVARRNGDAVSALVREHHGQWTADRIVEGWPEYRAATRKLLGAIRARIAHEERDVFPLLR